MKKASDIFKGLPNGSEFLDGSVLRRESLESGQADRIPGAELSPLNCEDSCGYGHLQEVWLESEDKYFCAMCIEEYWLEELSLLVDNQEDEDMWDYWQKLNITAKADPDDEFTGFKVVHPEPWPSQEIPLKQLEQMRREIKERATGERKDPLSALEKDLSLALLAFLDEISRQNQCQFWKKQFSMALEALNAAGIKTPYGV